MRGKQERTLVEELPGGLKKTFESNVDPAEQILISLVGNAGEALVASDKKAYVLKAGYAAGAMFGGKCKAFPYRHITSVEFSCALTAGRIQITTAGAAEQSHGWKQSGILSSLADARQAENVVNFPKAKKDVFQEAATLIRQMADEVHAEKPAAAVAAPDPTDQIRKLAGLLKDGIITQAEFDAKKKQLLEL